MICKEKRFENINTREERRYICFLQLFVYYFFFFFSRESNGLFPTLFHTLLNSVTVFSFVLYKQTRSLCISRRIRIRISQQRLNTGENCCHIVNRTPFVLQNVQTNRTVRVHFKKMGGKSEKSKEKWKGDQPLG